MMLGWRKRSLGEEETVQESAEEKRNPENREEKSKATHPFDSDDEDSWSDRSGVDPVAPAILVDPHSGGQHSKHGYTGALGFIKVSQSWDNETHSTCETNLFHLDIEK